MRYRNTTTERRKGLTLVEMMIALALSIFIMAILSEAFITGLNAFGNFKALADLDQRLRTAANIIRRDLKAPHFDGSKRLSECTVSGRPMPMLDGLLANVYPNVQSGQIVHRELQQYRFKPPLEGFFSIEEWPNRPGAPPRITSTFEGVDGSSRPSYRDRYDVLHFTSRLEGNEPDKFFFGRVRLPVLPAYPSLDNAGLSQGSTRYDTGGNGMYSSQAAEMLYFMGDDETVLLPGVDTQGGPVRTFNLYRQAWLLVPDRFSDGVTTPVQDTFPYTLATGSFAQNNDISAYRQASDANWYNTMASVQHRERRVGANPVNPLSLPLPPGVSPANQPVMVARSPKTLANGTLEGSDILLTNVISFDVKVFDPFAYKLPRTPGSGRGAYVDIGDVYYDSSLINPVTGLPFTMPTASGDASDGLQPAFGGQENSPALEYFDTGTSRFEGPIDPLNPAIPSRFSPYHSPATHAYPFPSIQITIRVFEPKSRQTRQITIIQDM